MEKNKLKEIEAKLQQLLKQDNNSRKPVAATPLRKVSGVEVIRRRKGHSDLHIN